MENKKINIKEKIILTHIGKYRRVGLYELKEELNCSVSAINDMLWKLKVEEYFYIEGSKYLLSEKGRKFVLLSTKLDEDEYSEDFVGSELYNGNINESGFPMIESGANLIEILKLKHLDELAYHKFSISGRTKVRTITAPSFRLKARQRWILRNILDKIPIDDSAHGFVKGRSIKTNAEKHTNRMEILCLDISDFFGTIKAESVYQVFKECGYDNEVATMLTSLCTYNGYLPQGAPTSPALANIIFKSCDIKLKKLAISNNLVYSRYADDMTFSTDLSNISKYVIDIKKILSDEGYRINEKKTHIMVGKQRKIVTGLLVNDRVKILGEYKRKFRQEIYYCKKYGIESHLRNTENNDVSGFKEYMYGKAYFICMVEKDYGQKLLQELDEIFILQ